MKRNLILIMALTFLASGKSLSQFTYGVKAGINLQNLRGDDDENEKLKNDLKPGFHAGVEVEIPLVPEIYLQPGILFSLKGAANIAEIEDLSATLSYIEVPIHVAYKTAAGPGKLFVGAGPYFAYGVSGKMKFKGEKEDIKLKNHVSDEDFNDYFFFLRPFDAGADIFIGYQLKPGIFAQLNAQFGLLNLEPEYEVSSNATTKNIGFSFSVGYRF